jgi:hypothetical protein
MHAYGFSPDHNLGVLLYVLTQRDVAAYVSWLNWLDQNATKTQLCNGDGGPDDHCSQQNWPRSCTEDVGHGKKPTKVPLLELYDGECVFRPWDGLDFAAINQALEVTPPRHMRDWDVQSRGLLRGAKITIASLNPVTKFLEAPPLIFMASFEDEKSYPLHLDAVRCIDQDVDTKSHLETWRRS